MTILGFLAFIFIFSFLIFIHELGHFVAARRSGVKVLEFGMGMGKKLWGKKVGETEYTLNAIPFGGFVRMLGEEESSSDPRSLEKATLWKRMVITLAGVFMNFLFAFIALTVVFALGTETFFFSESAFHEAREKGAIEFQTGEGEPIAFESIKELSPEAQRGVIRIPVSEKLRQPFPRAIWSGFKGTFYIGKMIVNRVIQLPGEIIREKSLPEDISGPVGIANQVIDNVPRGGWFLLRIAILLSISLGVMNLLPIPALDGGRFLFQLVELILKPFHKKPDPKIEMAVHLAGFMFLMFFMIAVTIRDVIRLDWFW